MDVAGTAIEAAVARRNGELAGEAKLNTDNAPPLYGPSTGTPMYLAWSGVSLVSFAPSLSRCSRATFSSRCFGSTYTFFSYLPCWSPARSGRSSGW